MKFLHLTMPIYKQKKNGKRLLLGWNQISNLNRYAKNSIKQWYTREVIKRIDGEEKINYDGKYSLVLTLYYKNKRSDRNNVCAVAEKYTLDALQVYGLITEDDVEHSIECHSYVGGRDKGNPRIEIELFKRE